MVAISKSQSTISFANNIMSPWGLNMFKTSKACSLDLYKHLLRTHRPYKLLNEQIGSTKQRESKYTSFVRDAAWCVQWGRRWWHKLSHVLFPLCRMWPTKTEKPLTWQRRSAVCGQWQLSDYFNDYFKLWVIFKTRDKVLRSPDAVCLD